MTTTTTAARCSRCGRKHRSWRRVALCKWPREWVCGDPPFEGPAFGSVSSCMGFRRSGPTVVLFGSREKAEAAKRVIDATACGSNCSRSHRVIELARDGRVRA